MKVSVPVIGASVFVTILCAASACVGYALRQRDEATNDQIIDLRGK